MWKHSHFFIKMESTILNHWKKENLLAVQGTLKSLLHHHSSKHQFFSAQPSSQSNSHIQYPNDCLEMGHGEMCEGRIRKGYEKICGALGVFLSWFFQKFHGGDTYICQNIKLYTLNTWDLLHINFDSKAMESKKGRERETERKEQRNLL